MLKSDKKSAKPKILWSKKSTVPIYEPMLNINISELCMRKLVINVGSGVPAKGARTPRMSSWGKSPLKVPNSILPLWTILSGGVFISLLYKISSEKRFQSPNCKSKKNKSLAKKFPCEFQIYGWKYIYIEDFWRQLWL